MLYVLYKNSGVYSGRALRRQLADMYDNKVAGGYPKRLASVRARRSDPDIIVNLGVTDELDFSGRILNPRDMVRAASNKKKARQTFAENEVPAPRLFLRGRDVHKADLPVIGRTSYHSKGKGFWYCKTLRDVQRAVDAGATHFLEFISRTREYRVHTFIKKKYLEVPREERSPDHFVSIKISEKVWTQNGAPDPDAPQKNHEFGWTFLGQQNRRAEELDVVRYAAKQAIASLGMDFGAVDVMYRMRNKRPYVLEVNSTPSLADDSSDTCERYARRILRTIGANKEDESDA